MNWKFWQHKQVQNAVPDDHQKTLTPALVSDANQCKTVLNLARRLQEGDALNIALTGPYGSGKSSILGTLMHDFSEYVYLPISLATLKSSSDTKKITSDDDIAALNSRIEYSILQQLEYKEKQETLYNSRFRRVYHKASYKQLLMALGIVAYVICLVIVFEPSFLHVDWICNFLNSPSLNKWADICSLTYLLFATIYGVLVSIKSLGNSKLNKLNLKDGEIELKEETSVFNKHLDEIIYFFQVTKYNVVILEDLDRFNNTEIFLKLREVNQLLNQSKAIGRKIVFIYAVRDDMFLDEERTKFFDYITTVIPIINSSNSADMLKTELENKNLTGLSDEVIESVSFFIDDMRLLKNNINEYAQYREKLSSNLDQNKLLAMIVYKNYYPKDFADLHKGDGIIYKCLHMKDALLEERNKQINKKIEECNRKIACVEATHILLEKELRLIYVEAYRNKLIQNGAQTLVTFIVNNNGYTTESIAANESIFNTFIQQDEITFHYQSGYSTYSKSSTIKFNQIEKIVNSDYTYAERLSSIREGESIYREQIKKLELSRNIHYSTPIMQLLDNINMQDDKVFKDIEVPKMLESFLKEGLINEDYYDYISFFFGKSINKHDHDFVLEIKLGHSKPYNYAIDKVDQCVKNIPQVCYHQTNILNIQLVDYICQNLDCEGNDVNLHAISQTIIKSGKWDFLIDFYRTVENPQPMFASIANIANNFWKVIARINKDDMYEAWLRYAELEHSTRDSRAWIERNYSFISKRIDTIGLNSAIQIIQEGNIVFSSIDFESDKLLEYVAKNKTYMLTPSNVSCTFAHYRGERVENLEKYPLNLTIIKSCEAASPVKEYIYDYLEDSLSDVFVTDAAKNESSSVVIELLVSDTLKEETKRLYLTRQNAKISFDDVEPKYWDFAVELDIVVPVWKEINTYYEQQGSVLSINIRNFIIKHINELNDIRTLLDTQKSSLAKSILLTSDFDTSVYEKLISIFKNVEFGDEDISGVDDNHLILLIKNKMIPYSSWYTEQIKVNHPNALYDFVNLYFDEHIADLENLPTDVKMFKFLMNKVQGRGDIALSIVNRYLPQIVWDSEIANLIAPTIVRHLDEFDTDITFKLIQHCSDLHLRQDVLIVSIARLQNDNAEIDKFLAEMGNPYSTIVDHSKKASLSRNDINRTILQKLKDVGYISSFSEKDDKYRVNHKRT